MEEYKNDLCCPTCVTTDLEKNEFCLPFDCAVNQSNYPIFPSPNSCMPKDELAELKVLIDAANDLLLDLGLEDHVTNRELFQKTFKGLVGLCVSVKLSTEVKIDLNGTVFLVGFDFVVIRNEDQEILIPYDSISSVKIKGRFADPSSEPLLLNIDPCFRRELTIHFGRTVAANPELVHIFFGMTLAIYLLLLIDKKMKIVQNGSTLEADLFDVNKDSIAVKVYDEMKIVPNDKILAILVQDKRTNINPVVS